jgi:voltage-gated potassium channel Kch
VLSMADVVAPAFAGPCLGQDLLSVIRGPLGVEGVHAVDGEPQRVKVSWSTPRGARRVAAFLHARLHPFDTSVQLLLGSVAGLVAVFAAETLMTIFAEGFSVVDAVYAVATATVTADPNPAAEIGGDWFKVVSTVLMLLSLGFVAVLTASLVNWLLDPRLTSIAGRAVVPRRDHVVVVGLGQVGLRLCGLLRELGVPVVAVEQNPQAKNVLRAKDRRVPVVIGSGSSQGLLRRVSTHRARALAAVTSDEIENLAIAVSARDVHSDLHLTFRAGDGDLTADTRSLFKVGAVRDVYAIAGTALAAVALGHPARHAFQLEDRVYLVDEFGDIKPFGAAGRPV